MLNLSFLTSSILVTQVRKPPDISQVYSKTNYTEQKVGFTAPFLTFRFLFHAKVHLFCGITGFFFDKVLIDTVTI